VEYDLAITYGEGWVKKQFCGMTSNVFYEITGQKIEEKFVQEFILKPSFVFWR
jgi:hypothetical protein